MRFLIYLILSWLGFFTINRAISGIIYLILQITIIGWLPASIWAIYSLGQYKTDKKIEKMMKQQN
ncbi:MAG: YqaE/Pmp3 family membrane protein [Campylobacter sp.]|nr:YqaE/Pmp3 family membrane protein [Campylobacter sp.]